MADSIEETLATMLLQMQEQQHNDSVAMQMILEMISSSRVIQDTSSKHLVRPFQNFVTMSTITSLLAHVLHAMKTSLNMMQVNWTIQQKPGYF